MIFSTLNISNQKSLIKNQQSFYHLILNLMTLGYWYYTAIGCSSGSCAITSKPINSTLYGGLLGGLIGNLFEKKSKN
ncbi:MAG: hypothetical protein EAZ58_03015 [Flavobacterium sp.]|nr:MAG: hypothetical protein EAZ58_03015 [Flavobacterium sp.]